MLEKKSLGNCQNQKIRDMTSFIAEKIQEKCGSIQGLSTFKWEAHLGFSVRKPELAFLCGKKGYCNDLFTYEGSRKCGIGKGLMKLCLSDGDITKDGGYDLSTEDWNDDELAPQVLNLCQTIVYISCAIYDDDVPPITCKMYMDAAKESGYDLVFVEKYGMERYHRYKIETAKSIFVKNADDFLEKQGNNWYFCKCKEGKEQACLGSIFGTLLFHCSQIKYDYTVLLWFMKISYVNLFQLWPTSK